MMENTTASIVGRYCQVHGVYPAWMQWRPQCSEHYTINYPVYTSPPVPQMSEREELKNDARIRELEAKVAQLEMDVCPWCKIDEESLQAFLKRVPQR